MMEHQINRTILIVCEGEGTEPSYFNSIRDILLEKGFKVKITISPMPKEEKETAFIPRTGAKKRELIKISASKEAVIKQYEIEDAFKAQPIRYVREAQMGLEDGTFDEVWAVFDQNGHPKHEEAFALANQIVANKKVNIGFSSVSFEQWILMHFEKSSKAYSKSRCREGRVFFNCATGINAKDCKGELCICGYMTEKKYLNKNWNEKGILFNELPDYSRAINNSVWLRKLKFTDPMIPIFKINPYTTLDKLIFNLMQLPKIFTWVNTNDTIINENASFQIVRKNNDVTIEVKNLGEARIILLADSLNLVNAKGELFPLGKRTLLDVREVVNIGLNLSEFDKFEPTYIAYKMNDNEFKIMDLW